MQKSFKPHHLNATPIDLSGNQGVGRYIILPGSDGRAREIAHHFQDVTVKQHSRGHHLYLGTLNNKGRVIDVACISSGMGCPSMEIILHELFQLGGKRFLRVGTAGSLQSCVKIGDIVNAQASVRDEDTTSHYVPISVPAVASLASMQAIVTAAEKLKLMERLHTGVVHCKSSLYARELGAGPNAAVNQAYLNLLTQAGVLATEMETAALFIQTQLYNHQMIQQGTGPQYKVLAGAILAVLAAPPYVFPEEEEQKPIINELVELAIESVKSLAASEW